MHTVNLAEITPAEYNPRKISTEAFDQLKDSVARLGILKPIIVRKENATIVAGHQRTKAMKACGITHCPAFILEGVGLQDEIRFNQYHNMTEVAIADAQPKLRVKKEVPTGSFIELDPTEFDVVSPGYMGAILKKLCGMVIAYGQFGSVIVTPEGEVIVSAAYAYAAILSNTKVHAISCKAEDVEYIRRVFAMDFGVFSYENVPKPVFAQGFAQKFRLRESKTGNENAGNSKLYDSMVIPFIKKNQRVVDFGAGFSDYAKALRKEGYDIKTLEFFLRKPGTNLIDYDKVIKDFKALERSIRQYGLFDVVVCDSVLNSVHSLYAEGAVLKTLNLLCKPGGRIFWSGRPPDKRASMKTSGSGKTDYIKFVDADGFTGNFRNGQWFYQKFHTQEQAEALTRKYHGDDFRYQATTMSFQVSVTKSASLSRQDALDALRFEFTLPLPNGRRYTIWDDNQEFFNHVINLNGYDN